jgi:hypothetical protein
MCCNFGLRTKKKMSSSAQQKRILVAVFESYSGSLSTGMTSSKFIKIMKVFHAQKRCL